MYGSNALLRQVLRRSRLFARLGDSEIDAILAHATVSKYAEGDQVLAKGDPGAEKLFLFSRTHRILALDSNGLRVLLRLGYGEERKSYSSTYRSAQYAVERELKKDYDWLIAAHQLLRHHGQELCKTARPLCSRCPLKSSCRYYQEVRPKRKSV